MPQSLGLGLPVFVELQATNGSCWSTKFLGSSVRKNDETQFKAKGEVPVLP
jgi:hypothetical protein